MLERVHRRIRSTGYGLSPYLIEKIDEARKGHLSRSAFIRMAIVKELRRLNIWVEE